MTLEDTHLHRAGIKGNSTHGQGGSCAELWLGEIESTKLMTKRQKCKAFGIRYRALICIPLGIEAQIRKGNQTLPLNSKEAAMALMPIGERAALIQCS